MSDLTYSEWVQEYQARRQRVADLEQELRAAKEADDYWYEVGMDHNYVTQQ